MKKLLTISAVLVLVVSSVYFLLNISTLAEYKVPDLTGKTVKDAEKVIDQTKALTFGEVTRETSPRPTDTIIQQEPAPGDLYKPGDRIDLVIAKGPGDVGEDPKPVPGPEMQAEMQELKAQVEEVLRNRGWDLSPAEFSLKGQMRYKVSVRQEETGPVYVWRIFYDIRAVLKNDKSPTKGLEGVQKNWAFDRDRGRQLALKALAENVAGHVIKTLGRNKEKALL